jgi:aspartate aminotransferase-like enzyme
MSVDVEDTIFLLPGPVKMHPRVVRAMDRPAMNHRGKAFRDVNAEIRELLREAFATEHDVAVLSGSGTAGLEACVASVLRRDDEVLCLVSGKFSERLHELCRLHAKATALEFPWGGGIDLERVASTLEEGDYRALAFCHNETSTGVTNPAREVADLARKHDLLTLVDGITSVAGIEVRPDAWGLDLVVTGSQKCLAAPPGLAAVAVSPRALEACHDETAYYLNLRRHVEALQRDDTPYTPAVPLFLALREALRLLHEEGLETRIRRTAKLAEATRAAAKAMGLSLFPEESLASNTVTAVRYPPGVEDGAFRRRLLEAHRVVLAGGQAQLKGTIFRIGHMGVCSFGDLVPAFAAMERVLDDLGHPVAFGRSLEAAQKAMEADGTSPPGR